MGSKILFISTLALMHLSAQAKDFIVTGTVTDTRGTAISGASVIMKSGKLEFRSVSDRSGNYSLRISGIYGNISGLLESGIPYPNPFTNQVKVPFIINSKGDIRFTVYSLQGKKINELLFPAVEPGSYNIIWNGCSAYGSPVAAGFYIYAVSFRGEIRSGRLIKAINVGNGSAATTLEQIMTPQVNAQTSTLSSLDVITSVTAANFNSLRITDITISSDTVVDFELSARSTLPFKTNTDHIAVLTNSGYKSMILKGINLGSSPPGTFPGEIAYAISAENYEKWIARIGRAGFNCIRVYTLHPPVFYEKLANYNFHHREKPVYLFQGIWLDEPESKTDMDLIARSEAFTGTIRENIDCIHGNRNIDLRPGKAYGNYQTDISEWTAGYIIGREVSPFEIKATDQLHPSMTSFKGFQFGIETGSPTEVFIAGMLDEVVRYENVKYTVFRPSSFSSWPTLDPLAHPTEINTDEDAASFDVYKIKGKSENAGLFATYHAYPYYPNFISMQPSYLGHNDAEGPNSYALYLSDLKVHYSDMPLVIGEFGVPSSWGSAHWSYSGMEHGGYSEKQQGEKNIRLMRNILDSGCAGGFMFSWMDEWFKPTWIVQYLEAYGFNPGTGFIPTRQLWHNITSPEQNFGLIAFEQENVLPFVDYTADYSAGDISKISATHDNAYFYLNVELKNNIQPGDTVIVAFDTYKASVGESVLPNGRALANRSEFALQFIAGKDTSSYLVTRAYDMNGLTPRFNLADEFQMFRSTLTDGAPWRLMKWTNDGYELTESDIGLLPAARSDAFIPGERHAVVWSGGKMKIRVPWTMLHYYDPTRKNVIDGATSDDGGWTYNVNPVESDGISVAVYNKNEVTNTTSRYNWEKWLVVPGTVPREKKSLQLVETGLSLFPDFTN